MVQLVKFMMYIYAYALVNVNRCIVVGTALNQDRQYLSTEDLPTQQFTQSQLHHVQQLCSNSTTMSYSCSLITCSQFGPSLISGFCATYSEDTGLLSLASCPYFQSTGYNVTTPGYILLPRNLTQLNDYMCGPLNRKGLVCNECADGFGPSVTSFGYKCANCSDTWYGVPLFLFLEFVPITVFYLIILVFQISVTSAPMPCFIMYAQWFVAAFYLSIHSNSSLREIMFTEDGDLRLDMKIIHTFYGIFNLDFFLLAFPPFCISSRLKPIHIAFFGYISVFYPIVLICLTWACVELHDCNFRPLVCLWRPFHRCFVQLRRGWDTKSDIIDVFTTFFLLSYGRCTYQTLLLLTTQAIRSLNESGSYSRVYHGAVVDLSITVGSKNYLLFVIPAAIIFLVFNILPPLLLTLYPMRAFRLCLSKCRLNFIAVNIFVEKINSCYRNGLDGGQDMRSLSSLHFYLRIVIYFTGLLSYYILKKKSVWILNKVWFPIGTVFLTFALIVALTKPYQKAYMNYLDTLLLSNLALWCYVMTSKVSMLLITRMLILIPIVIFILTILMKMVRKVSNFKALSQKYHCRVRTLFTTKSIQQYRSTVSIQAVAKEQLPFIQPAYMEINYGTNNNGAKSYS